jgi:hypothetical protein
MGLWSYPEELKIGGIGTANVADRWLLSQAPVCTEVIMAFGQDSLCQGVMPRRRICAALRRVFTRERELIPARRGWEPPVLSSLKRKT